jgi:hypothetical protein
MLQSTDLESPLTGNQRDSGQSSFCSQRGNYSIGYEIWKRYAHLIHPITARSNSLVGVCYQKWAL